MSEQLLQQINNEAKNLYENFKTNQNKVKLKSGLRDILSFLRYYDKAKRQNVVDKKLDTLKEIIALNDENRDLFGNFKYRVATYIRKDK